MCINIKTVCVNASSNPIKLHPLKLISPFSLQILLRRGIGPNNNCLKVIVENYPLTLFHIVVEHCSVVIPVLWLCHKTKIFPAWIYQKFLWNFLIQLAV